MLRKQPYAILAVLSVLTIVPACAGRGGSASGGAGGSGSGNGGSAGGSNGTGSGTGNGGSSSGGTDGGTGGGMVTQPPVSGLALFAGSSCGGPVTVGSSPVRRLSRIEYDNMVHDLGLDPNNTQPATQFVTEQKIDNGKAGNFNTNAYATISGTLINQQYLEAAETLATAAVANSNVLAALLPSSSCGTKNAACASAFISSWANRAFRGQLDADETTALNTLYTTVSAQFDFPTGIQAVIEAVLTSPRFLFVLEFGQPSSDPSAVAVPLAPMELATRLALYLWRSIPDQTLIDAANGVNGGSLISASDVATQATRMLADPKAKSALADFADQWLDIENMNSVTKDTQFTKWTASVAADLHTESLTTFTQAVLGNSSFTSLLTSGSSYINGDLASFYGLSGSPTFSTRDDGQHRDQPADGDPEPGERAGDARPHLAAVADQAGADDPPADPVRGGPRPARLGRWHADPTAARRPSPAGHDARRPTFNTCRGTPCATTATSTWTGSGSASTTTTRPAHTSRRRTGPRSTRAGSSSPIRTRPTSSGTFTGMTDMITQLSKSDQVNQCFALEEIRYALLRRRSPRTPAQRSRSTRLSRPAASTSQKLIVAVVSSNSFMYRTPVSAGQACQ